MVCVQQRVLGPSQVKAHAEVFHRVRVVHRHMHIYNFLSHDRIVVGDFGLRSA